MHTWVWQTTHKEEEEEEEEEEKEEGEEEEGEEEEGEEEEGAGVETCQRTMTTPATHEPVDEYARDVTGSKTKQQGKKTQHTHLSQLHQDVQQANLVRATDLVHGSSILEGTHNHDHRSTHNVIVIVEQPGGQGSVCGKAHSPPTETQRPPTPQTHVR